MDEFVTEGNHVVLMKSFDSGNMKIIPAVRNKIVHYGKLHFDPSPLIGTKFGSVFEIQSETMIKVDNFEDFDKELSETVTNNLAAFNEKSQFSKEKIIKRKKKVNFANVVTVIRPSLILINEMLYARDKLGGLRSDSLGQILTSSGIQNGSKCLLLDHNLGILTSAVMSRSLPEGICIQLVPDKESISTIRNTLSMMNISEEACVNNLFSITVRDLYKVTKEVDFFSYENDVLRAKGEEHLNRLAQPENYTTRNQETGVKVQSEIMIESQRKDLQITLMKKDTNREVHNRERTKAASYLKSRSLDSIILIAQNDHPLPLIKLTYPFLAPSRQFVIYSDTVEPLLQCHQYLKTNSLAVSLNLCESWLRSYQVLPDRTRPEMNISGYGGYLLSGTKALCGSDTDCNVVVDRRNPSISESVR